MLILWLAQIPVIFVFLCFQSDIHYVGQALLKSAVIGPPDGHGLLKTLVPGTPDCRGMPVGDGLIGVDGQNCPFQMYAILGAFNISRGGQYTLCSTSADGYTLLRTAWKVFLASIDHGCVSDRICMWTG